MTKRFVLSVLVGGALALPAGIAVGSGGSEPEVSAGVAASDCPEAVAAREQAGLFPVERFVPGCPDPADIQAVETDPADVLAVDRLCEAYEAKPVWCPSAEEVEDAQSGGSE